MSSLTDLPILALRVVNMLSVIPAVAVTASPAEFGWQRIAGDSAFLAGLAAFQLLALVDLRVRKSHPRTRAILQRWLVALASMRWPELPFSIHRPIVR
jgi:hypothetical protein